MLRRSFFAVTATAAAVCAQSGAGTAKVRKTIDAFIAAVQKSDVIAVTRFLAADLIYTHSSGIVETRQEYLNKLKSGDQKYAGIELIKPTIRVYGNAAVINSQTRMHGATKGVPFDNTLLLMQVWTKQGNDWKLVAHQTTRTQ